MVDNDALTNKVINFKNCLIYTTEVFLYFFAQIVGSLIKVNIVAYKYKETCLLFFLGLSATSACATNQYSLPFASIQGGYQLAQDKSYDHGDPKSGVVGLSGGWLFSPNWSLEFGYQYHDDLEAEATSVNVSTQLIESAVRYNWYLQDDVSLYGRLGAAFWDMEKQNSSGTIQANGLSPLGEIGIQYLINPSVSFSAGYQYIHSIGDTSTGEYDSHALLFGLSYTFGRGTLTSTEALPIASYQAPNAETVQTMNIDTLQAEPAVAVKPKPAPKKTYIFSETSWLSGAGKDEAFSVNSTSVSVRFAEQLKAVASILNTHPQSRVDIVGHTDSTGSEAYNQTLSVRRAQEVAYSLGKLGVKTEQIHVDGKGESEPIADNTQAEGRAANRRVEVIISQFEYQE